MGPVASLVTAAAAVTFAASTLAGSSSGAKTPAAAPAVLLSPSESSATAAVTAKSKSKAAKSSFKAAVGAEGEASEDSASDASSVSTSSMPAGSSLIATTSFEGKTTIYLIGDPVTSDCTIKAGATTTGVVQKQVIGGESGKLELRTKAGPSLTCKLGHNIKLTVASGAMTVTGESSSGADSTGMVTSAQVGGVMILNVDHKVIFTANASKAVTDQLVQRKTESIVFDTRIPVWKMISVSGQVELARFSIGDVTQLPPAVIPIGGSSDNGTTGVRATTAIGGEF